jgi:hypothetical protein
MVTKKNCNNSLKDLSPSSGSGGRSDNCKYSYRNQWRGGFDHICCCVCIPTCNNSSACDNTNLEIDDDDSSYNMEESDQNSCCSDFSLDSFFSTEEEQSLSDQDDSDDPSPACSEDKGKSQCESNVFDTSSGHVLLPLDKLHDLLINYLRCDCGSRNGKIIKTTIGISTRLEYSCLQCKQCFVLEPEKVKGIDQMEDEIARNKILKKITSYSLNVRMILLAQAVGGSRQAAAFLAGLLDISDKILSMDWRTAEDTVGLKEIQLTEEIMIENQKEEIDGVEPDENGRYHVQVGSDMGWQQGQKRYNSPSGHAMVVGQRLGRVLALLVYSKLCSICYYATKKRNLEHIIVPKIIKVLVKGWSRKE